MQNTASFSAKSQNLGSISADKPLVIPAHEGVAELEKRTFIDVRSEARQVVIPVKTGIQSKTVLDSCFRRNDEGNAGMTKCSATPSRSVGTRLRPPSLTKLFVTI